MTNVNAIEHDHERTRLASQTMDFGFDFSSFNIHFPRVYFEENQQSHSIVFRAKAGCGSTITEASIDVVSIG